jgi:hypothetical protein
MRYVAALVVLFAAFMKWEQLPVLDRTGDGLLHQPAFIIPQIVFESVLAGWLLCGFWPRWTKCTPGVCFSLFATVALYFAMTGAESCGCFGRVKVNPWVTFGLDCLLAAGLFIWPPVGRSEDGGSRIEDCGEGGEDRGSRIEDREGRKSPGVAWRIVGVGGIAVLALVMSLRQLPKASAAPEMAGMLQAGALTILEPEKWAGKTLPILADLDIGERLKTGQWLAVLYHADCSTCREAVPGYERMAMSHPVALLEMPPFAHSGDDRLVPADTKALAGRLSDGREWFATTPVVILLEGGVVRDVVEGKAAVGAVVDWQAGLVGGKIEE